MSDDLARIIEPLARHFFGEPNRKLSSKGNLRFGAHGSLSVDLTKGTWYDHENTTGGGVLDLVDREKGVRGQDAVRWLESEHFLEPDYKPNSKGRIVATYDYVDACGELVFQAVRYAPKRFAQRRPDANGGWIWKLDGIKQVPYRLPELVEAISQERSVLIVEGEKDVDRLWSIGVPATCNAMGAGKWKPEHSAWFGGADDIVVVGDNDETGQAHAQAVARALKPIAKRVRVLDLAKIWPEIGPKGDISDWLDAEHTADELWAALDELPDWTATAPGNGADHDEAPDRGDPPIGEPKRPAARKGGGGEGKGDGEIMLVNAAEIEPEPINWLWNNGLQVGVLNLLAGRSGGGKSTIAVSWCATVTRGGQWPDGHTCRTPGRTVYWSGEDGIKDTLLPRFIAADGDRAKMSFVEGVRTGEDKRPFDPAVDMPMLARAVEKLGDVRMIVLDPIAVMVKGADSHKNVETRIGLQPFADLCASRGACGLGVHHFTKNTEGGDPLDRISGSLAFGALPRCGWVAAKDLNAAEGARRLLIRVKMSNGPDWGGFEYRLDRRELDGWPDITAQSVWWGDALEGTAKELLAQLETKPAAGSEAVAFLQSTLKDGPQMAVEVIASGKLQGLHERTLRRTLKKLGGLTEKASFNGPWLWQLP